VDKEGPQTEHIQGNAPNVVRLPVDWLGPRDELVPLGAPDAKALFGERASEQAPVSDHATMPPSAADFWGERAEAVQDVLQAPAPRAPHPAPRESRDPEPARGRLVLVVAAAGLLVVAAAALIAGLAGQSSPERSASAEAAIPALLPSPNHRTLKLRYKLPSRRLGHARHVTKARHYAHRAVTPVRYSAPSAPASTPAAGPSYSSSSPSVSSGTGGPSSTGGDAGAASTSHGSGNVSPTGAGGALGPIGSPNG
jgi:hypothetical protein